METPTTSPGATLAARNWTWLYSGNLGRAHEWKILLDTQAELERRGLPIQLLFEGGGANWTQAQEQASALGLQRCHWCDYVSEEESALTFSASQLIVASQRAEVRGLLWPSKLARVIPTSKPLLWIGPPDGAVARSLGTRVNTGCFTPLAVTPIANWIERLFSARPDCVDGQIEKSAIKGERDRGCELWSQWVAEIVLARNLKT